MTEDRQARIRAEIEAYRAILWTYANQDQVVELAERNHAHAVWAVSEGAGVSEDAAAIALDPDLGLREWGRSNVADMERAIVDLETWLEAGPDDLHPAAARALAPILAELASTGGPAFRFEHEPVDIGENLMLIAWEPGGIGTGIWVDPFGSDEDNILNVSSAIYEAAVEATHNAWPKT